MLGSFGFVLPGLVLMTDHIACQLSIRALFWGDAGVHQRAVGSQALVDADCKVRTRLHGQRHHRSASTSSWRCSSPRVRLGARAAVVGRSLSTIVDQMAVAEQRAITDLLGGGGGEVNLLRRLVGLDSSWSVKHRTQ